MNPSFAHIPHEVDDDVPVLRVRNFSCLKDLTVRFNRLVVLIGEQASGKSVTCKLYYFFTEALQKVAQSCLWDDVDSDDFKKRLGGEFESIFPSPAWVSDSFAIEWKFRDFVARIEHKGRNHRVTLDIGEYERRYTNVLERVRSEKKGQRKRVGFDYHWHLDKVIQNTLSGEFPALNVVYVPAGRSFFSTIHDAVFSLLSNNIGIDYFLKDFGHRLEVFRQFEYQFSSGRMTSLFEGWCRDIVHGTYSYDGKEQWISSDKKHRIRLSDASSGQQEALPLLMVLARFAEMSEKRTGMNRIVIEEPEAHLYPTAQQAIVKALGDLLQVNRGAIITTHSPFILCCVNNVLLKLQPELRSVSAYHLHDGGGDAIYDPELTVINAERFDDISIGIANA